MASLLGGQFCMESLQTDVQDLQSAINDVFSRVGPVRYPSWKYPDKMSCDLDVDELLEFHRYSTDNSEEERQMSHVVLYELVIDRLVLLLQGMTKYSEGALLSGKSPLGADPPSHTSLGLVVKKYWRRIVQLHALSTQLNSECRSKERKINELQDSAANTSDESIKFKEGGSVSSQIGFGGLIPPSSSELHSVMGSPISHDCCHKSSQTLETAFVPCESCLCVQKNMKDTGDCVISMCQSQGLPSSLLKFKPHVVNNDWLTANEVSQWNSEQIKDLNRVSKHLEQLFSTSENLKSEIKQLDIKCAKLQEKAEKADKEVKVEKETQRGMSVQFEAKVASLKSEHSEHLNRVNEEKSNLEKNRLQMEEQLQKYKDELMGQKKLLESLKVSQCELEGELERTRSETVNAQSLQATVERLTTEVDHVTRQLEAANSQLTKEQAKSKSASKHSQSLQNKQGTLLQQLESLGQENEELKGQVSELEEVKEALEGDLKTSKQQMEQFEIRAREDTVIITKLRAEKCELEKSITETEQCLAELEAKLTESREQQRLLAEFPDLNGPVHHNVQGTGDIMTDMERQIEANSLRIRLLEEQNDSFRSSVHKMLQSRDGSRQLPQPVPLWKQSGLDTLTENPESHRAGTVQYKAEWSNPVDRKSKSQTNDDGNQKQNPSLKSASSSSMTKTEETFLIGRSMRPDSASRGRNSRTPQRPSSSNKESRNNKVAAPSNPSLSVYKQLKNSGKIGSAGPRNYGQGGLETNSYLPSETFTCAQCDKIYSNKRDLEIHKSYCTG